MTTRKRRKALRRRLGGCRGAVLLELDVQQRLHDGLHTQHEGVR